MIIHPSTLGGSIAIQPSKSVLHRALICAALAKGKSTISNFVLSEDTRATLVALRDMGFCTYHINKDVCIIQGGLQRKTKPIINCGESGSTLRFLIPLAFDGQSRLFKGEGRLMERPMEPYEKLFGNSGYRKTKDGIEVCGTLESGTFPIRGDVSSQFISGLLFKLPLLEGSSTIQLTTPLESYPYVDLTVQMQKIFGVQITASEHAYTAQGKQQYLPTSVHIEGDYSHAAFFAVAAAINGRVDLHGLEKDSLQGDREILNLLNIMGAEVHWQNGIVTVSKGELKPIDIDVSQIPDLVPPLSIAACAASGRTALYNAGRLRLKESDRLHALATELEKVGGDVMEYEDQLIIYGVDQLKGGDVHTHGDHRIAMALSIASSMSADDIHLDQPNVVSKSAPSFFDEYKELGGIIS